MESIETNDMGIKPSAKTENEKNKKKLQAEGSKYLQVPKILIVEDDTTLRPIWSYIVERADRRAIIDWVTSESEAEKYILDSLESGFDYDLVITDIFLSGSKTGIDLWNEFYHDLKGRMIITSGIEFTKFVRYVGKYKGIEQPMYLQKPLNTHECVEAVYGMLQKTS